MPNESEPLLNQPMPNDRSELHAAFVEAYPMYVARVLSERGVRVDEVLADAIVEGTHVLDGLMTSFDRTPLLEQRTSPLELFREALRPVDRALDLRGAPRAADVPPGHAVWDRYGLVPGSSQVLGETAHEAHLRWGVEKATALAPLVNRADASDGEETGGLPGAVVLTTDARTAGVRASVRRMGYEPVTSGTARVSVAVVDADLGGIAHEAIRGLAARGVHVVAIAAEVDDLVEGGLRALGADRVASLGDFTDDPSAYLPTVT